MDRGRERSCRNIISTHPGFSMVSPAFGLKIFGESIGIIYRITILNVGVYRSGTALGNGGPAAEWSGGHRPHISIHVQFKDLGTDDELKVIMVQYTLYHGGAGVSCIKVLGAFLFISFWWASPCCVSPLHGMKPVYWHTKIYLTTPCTL